jgi:hypothetical protein
MITWFDRFNELGCEMNQAREKVNRREPDGPQKLERCLTEIVVLVDQYNLAGRPSFHSELPPKLR